jgi:hypothetical protein
MCGIFRAFLAVAAVLIAADPALGADKVDCHELDLAFSPADKADWTECYRFHLSEPPSGEGAEGASVDVEILMADIGSHVVHISSALAGKDTYFDKVPASQKLKNFDELEKVESIGSEPDFRRYQIIRFRASLWKTPTDCFGFVKYGGATIGSGGSSYGARSYVAGYDCWRNGAPDRAQIEATLSAIKD